MNEIITRRLLAVMRKESERLKLAAQIVDGAKSAQNGMRYVARNLDAAVRRETKQLEAIAAEEARP